jgi:hypothetical protein
MWEDHRGFGNQGVKDLIVQPTVMHIVVKFLDEST